jgi:hypothetical protein
MALWDANQRQTRRPRAIEPFIDIAQEGGADNDADALDRAFKKIVPPKRDETQKRP